MKKYILSLKKTLVLIFLGSAQTFFIWQAGVDIQYFLILFFLVLTTISYFLYSSLKERSNFNSLFKYSQKFTQELAGTGEQILGSCNQINESVSSQSSAVIETSTASDEISVMIKRNTENIQTVSEFINSIGELVRKSSISNKKLQTKMNEGIETNDRVLDLLENTTKGLEDLTLQFAEVVQKTGVINDIVFQTKLLSFNASVEAARAGEHGKGFSVVAEEIGNLATLSGDSATAIQGTLEATEVKVKGIIDVINKNKESLKSLLNEHSSDTQNILIDFNTNFSNVQNDVEKIITEIDSVKVASMEQEKGVVEMRDGIHSVNNSVQRNTLVIGQTDSLANILNTEIDKFNSILTSFEVKGEKSKNILDIIPWDDKFRIGINDMDEEHIIILERINTLIVDMNESSNNIVKSFNALKDYTITHFCHEEKYLRSFEYSSYESHKQVHENLLAVLGDFENKIKEGKLDKSKLASFLKNWLFTHIMGVDIKYAEEAKEKDLKNVA